MMKTAIRAGTIGAMLCLTAACTSGQNGAPAQPVHFSCTGGPNIAVRFGSGSAVLEVGGTSVAMTQTRTADGFRYAGDGQAIRGKGQELRWSDEKGRTLLCHAMPATD